MEKINEDMQPEVIGQSDIENQGRRKIVKNIVFGVSAIAAYNAFPAKWGTPILEQVFLPAHAQTSAVGDQEIPLDDQQEIPR